MSDYFKRFKKVLYEFHEDVRPQKKYGNMGLYFTSASFITFCAGLNIPGSFLALLGIGHYINSEFEHRENQELLRKMDENIENDYKQMLRDIHGETQELLKEVNEYLIEQNLREL